MHIKQYITDLTYKTNTYLLICENKNEGLIIDPSDNCEEMIRYIDENNILIRYIINTHCHPDHCSGNYLIHKKFNSLLLISEKEEKLLNSLMETGFISRNTAPLQFIRDGDVIQIGKEQILLIETPGHTEGSMSIVADNNIFVGDLIINSKKIDINKQYIHTFIEKILLLKKENITIYPGHGLPMQFEEIIDI
jgi:hydroxyacylglutathione hydrolase